LKGIIAEYGIFKPKIQTMRYILSFTVLFALFSCSNPAEKTETVTEKRNVVTTDELEIHYAEQQAATLFLFPCFSCDANQTKTEFKILDSAYTNGVSVVLLNFNFRLSLDSFERNMLKDFLNEVIDYYQLPSQNITIGGYSGGGNVSLLLANYLIEQNNKYQPKGVFVVDPPIDLWNIYRSSTLNLERNFSEPSVQESNLLIGLLDSIVGEENHFPDSFAIHSPIVNEIQNYNNISHLKQIKVRLYTEPDSIWWKENRQADFNQTNSYALEQFYNNQKSEFNQLELIETRNKGVRGDGSRHPHSWSIVNTNELIEWIKK
jgi:predicted alpha/beta-fold hydrolase